VIKAACSHENYAKEEISTLNTDPSQLFLYGRVSHPNSNQGEQMANVEKNRDELLDHVE